MKKIIYYVSFLLLLFLISIIPTSAKEFKTCVRTTSNLRVRDYLVDDNLNAILETPCVDEVAKIYDYANLLDDLEEEDLYLKVTDYISKTNYDLVLLTIDENNKGSASSYADDFYDYNYFGYNDTRDGVLILIDMDTRELYISTTGYAIKMYLDSTLDTILDSGYTYIFDENYYETLKVMIEGLEINFQDEYPASNSDILINEYGEVYYLKYIPYKIVFLIASLITIIVSVIIYQKSILKIKAISTISYLNDKSLTLQTDKFLNSVVTHTRKSSSSYSSSGGSRRSGSSSHRSSSGSSHGGRGRRF